MLAQERCLPLVRYHQEVVPAHSPRTLRRVWGSLWVTALKLWWEAAARGDGKRG